MVFKEATALPDVVKRIDWRCVLTLTHVCRLWRIMVVAEASLWSHLYLNDAGPRCVELFIRRSSELPLIIHTSFDELPLLDDVLDTHGFRAQAIHVDNECDEQVSIGVLHMFHWSAPQLECFVLRAFVKWQLEDELLEWRIFDEHISPLKALRLEGISFLHCMPTNFFWNLTHLLLFPASYDVHFRLLGMLATMPRLKYLHFISLDLPIYPEYDPALYLVSLRHLRVFSVHYSDFEVALFLLRHLDLPAECAVCINGGGCASDFSDPATFPRADALDIPPLCAFDAVTRMDLSAWFDGFLLAGYNAPALTAGFFFQSSGCYSHWTWLADKVHTMLPLSNITVLHASFDDPDRLTQVLPPMLQHFPRVHELCVLLTVPTYAIPPRQDGRGLAELCLDALLPAANSGSASDGTVTAVTVCPKLRVLGLEAELAHDVFPFSALERTAAARQEAGHRLARVVYHPHTRRHDSRDVRARFRASFAPLAAFVDVVEYRGAADARVCPFRSPRGGCWDVDEAERYWRLPGRLMSYDWGPDPQNLDPGLEETGKEDDGGGQLEAQ